jgi:hypothetical protein
MSRGSVIIPSVILVAGGLKSTRNGRTRRRSQHLSTDVNREHLKCADVTPPQPA